MISRRGFLKTGGVLTAASLLAAPRYSNVLSSLAVNDRVNVALIGCGSMGWANLTDFLTYENVRCVALCDVSQPLLGARTSELEAKFDQKADQCKDYRRILDRDDVDIVIIATPDHWHCLQFVDSCSAGKSVYVEKPISNSIAECDVMVSAANRYGTVVQVGQQQRSGMHWKEMIKYIDEGHLGKIGQVNVWANFRYAVINRTIPDVDIPDGVDFDMWLGPARKTPFNIFKFRGMWRTFWDYGGGLLTDWGVHLLDMALWGMKVNSLPCQTIAVGGNYFYPNGEHETFDSLNVTYQFDDFVINWSNSAGIETGLGGRNYGVMFRGTNGSIVADRNNWEIIPESNKLAYRKVESDNNDHLDHVTNFLQCVDGKNRNTACPIEVGSLSTKYAHVGNISARMGGVPLIYNDKHMTFNDVSANRFIKPEYHNSWQFPHKYL